MAQETLDSLDKFPWAWLQRQKNFFLTEIYVANWLTHLGDGELNAKVSYDSRGSIRYFFPIINSQESIISIRTRVWKCTGWNSAWYPFSFFPCDIETAHKFVRFLLDSKRHWDSALVCCPENIFHKMVREVSTSEFVVVEQYKQIFPFIRIKTSWDEYWKEVKYRSNNNTERYLRKIMKSGKITYRYAEDIDECKEIINKYVELHYKRWGSKKKRSKYQIQKHRNFLEALSVHLLREGKLFLRYLKFNDAIISIAICILDEKKIYYVWPTFDLNYKEFAPGKLLLYFLVQEAFQLGCTEVDLGPGGDEYKFIWSNDARHIRKFMILQKKLPVLLKYRVIPEVKNIMKAILKDVPKKS